MDKTLPIINTDFFNGRVKNESVSLEINHQIWALHDIFPIHIAAALWCSFNPHYFSEWGEREYIEVHNTVIILLRHLMTIDIEKNRTKHSREQLENAFKTVVERFNSSVTEFIEESRKYNVTRYQLKEIAEKVGVKPKFLYLDNEHRNIKADNLDEPEYKQTNDLLNQVYISEDVKILHQAINKFWLNADKDDKDTHPKQQQVIDWLVLQGFSKNKAETGASIIRPEWAAEGRRPKE